MFEDEKQLTKIINRVKFIREKILWLVELIKIFDLAIIIRAAIKILSRIKIVDMVSIDENLEIDRFVWWRWVMFIDEISVKINRVDRVTHQ